ncbi:hypothetical protein [Nostoc sp. PA-18-2419]|uniref:hypothetical protein n=1 Tax=Nostoc sp. PA-18-2419 TaxID=2575443 RepID=UPI001107EF90|nr:hypothetical protein [Nostoc sp. PA-18-2419]
MKNSKFRLKSVLSQLKTQYSAVVFVLIVGSIVLAGLSAIQPGTAQIIAPTDVWQVVYQKLPDFPRENKYISKENGKVAENNTLANRLIRYHIYTKGRAPNYRLDWKLTLADYLGANEIIYDTSYPGNDALRKNPLEGDRAAIAHLTRSQRNTLVQVLVNIFNPTSQTTSAPRSNTTASPVRPTTPQPPQGGGAELLK